MRVKEIFEFINKIAPFNTQMDFDNAGLLVGGMDEEVKKVGVVLAPEEVDKIGEEVAGMLKQSDKYRQQIETLMHKNLYNIGETGKSGGTYIISQLIQRQKQTKSEK